MNTKTTIPNPIATAPRGRANVVAACLAVLTREVHGAGLEKHDALDLLRDAPDKIDAALGRWWFTAWTVAGRGVWSVTASPVLGVSRPPPNKRAHRFSGFAPARLRSWRPISTRAQRL
ncbi:hypothetical protein [Profundibacterium mesophilum]|uniref:Uncharacterized protein n=1 Tax=Profundibacterium mesophilum KAUST100406-0324 TaxID=1037889 RepID=A0A921TBV2_9RHOB|nr:hypothetical protein [Profundibacterium mesophilum]KAF0676275.1 hypothetical protein PMES_01435 [Profundibacterium mesophilum KAUST100406-0324]